VRHNFINTGPQDLRLYTVYSPPEHAPGTVHRTKADADAAEVAEHATDGAIEPAATASYRCSTDSNALRRSDALRTTRRPAFGAPAAPPNVLRYLGLESSHPDRYGNASVGQCAPMSLAAHTSQPLGGDGRRRRARSDQYWADQISASTTIACGTGGDGGWAGAGSGVVDVTRSTWATPRSKPRRRKERWHPPRAGGMS